MFDGLSDQEIKRCLEFVVKADALKKIFRKTCVINSDRHENTAEHSWHLTLMALVLNRYANENLDIEKVLKMLVLHDIGEITEGDVDLYNAKRSSAQAGEHETIKELFSALPADMRDTFTALWEEFAHGETPEAHFARAMDRFQPFLSNLANDGGSWKYLKVSKEMAFAKNNHIAKGSEILWETYKNLAEKADEKGFFG